MPDLIIVQLRTQRHRHPNVALATVNTPIARFPAGGLSESESQGSLNPARPVNYKRRLNYDSAGKPSTRRCSRQQRWQRIQAQPVSKGRAVASRFFWPGRLRTCKRSPPGNRHARSPDEPPAGLLFTVSHGSGGTAAAAAAAAGVQTAFQSGSPPAAPSSTRSVAGQAQIPATFSALLQVVCCCVSSADRPDMVPAETDTVNAVNNV